MSIFLLEEDFGSQLSKNLGFAQNLSNLYNCHSPERKEQLQARISYPNKKIDQLVYQLYELTEEEIKIVEN